MESGREAAHGDVVSLLATKDAEIAALAARVTELEGLVAALQAQLGRDSSNSGKPPSSDSPFTKKPAAKRSVRTRSGKPQGKQPGAPSATLRLIDDPDDTITHTPPVCAGCGEDLADAEVFGVCRRQVFDVPPPPPRPYVTEHRVQSRTCGGCGTVTEATAPAVASGRVQYGPGVKARAAWLTCAHFLPVRRARRVLNALLGFAVSPGWVAGLRAQAARLLETRFLPHVRALIAAAPVAHADETTARAAGTLTYLHVACTRFLTAMHVGDRSKDTIDAGGVWPAFTGVLVRDGYAGYEHLDKIEHAWCGIHLVRDLRAVHDPDPEGQSWAEAMVNTLLLANDTAHTARAEGRAALTDAELSTIRSRYAGAIARGRQENTRGSDPLHAAGPHPAATLPATSGHDPAVHGEPGRELHEQHRRVAGQISEGSAADLRRLLAHPARTHRLRCRAVLPVHRDQVGPRHPRRDDPTVHHRCVAPTCPHPRHHRRCVVTPPRLNSYL